MLSHRCFSRFTNGANGTKSGKVSLIMSIDQKMLSGIGWAIFFYNPEN